MPIYRYKNRGITLQNLASLVPANPAIVAPTSAPIFVDINVGAGSKADLDDIMAGLGWIFVSTDPVTSTILDARSFPHTTKNVAAGGTIVLTSTEAEKEFVVLTGALLAAVILEFPAVDGAQWTVRNTSVLGAFTVNLRATGSAVLVPVGVGSMTVWCDGVDLFKKTGLIPL